MKKISKDVQKTAEIAQFFFRKILREKKNGKEATVVCLSGNLGTGKTIFTQGVAKYLGVKNRVISPTFVIMKKYPLKDKNHKFLFHLDAYRLKNEKELLNLGWKKIIENKENLVFIEWPENIKKAIPQGAKYIYISHGQGGERILRIK